MPHGLPHVALDLTMNGNITAPVPTQPPLTPALSRTRVLAVGSLLALVVLSLGWELWWAPVRPGGSWLAVKALPLCLPLAGLLKNKMYTYRWLSLDRKSTRLNSSHT